MARPLKATDGGTLRRRVVTACVLAPIVVAVILAGRLPTTALILLLAMAAAGEVADAAAGSHARSPVPIAVSGAALAILFGSTNTYGAAFLVIAVAVAGIAAVLHSRSGRVTALLVGYVGVAFLALVWVRGLPGGGLLLFWLITVVWASDGAAYVAGRSFGRRQLAPVISPNKTWSGLGGALAGGALGGVCVAGFLPSSLTAVPLDGVVEAGLAGAGLGAVGQAGDLLASAWKRALGRKDSGVLIPGHGGVLDRADALLASGLAISILAMLGGHT